MFLEHWTKSQTACHVGKSATLWVCLFICKMGIMIITSSLGHGEDRMEPCLLKCSANTPELHEGGDVLLSGKMLAGWKVMAGGPVPAESQLSSRSQAEGSPFSVLDPPGLVQ